MATQAEMAGAGLAIADAALDGSGDTGSVGMGTSRNRNAGRIDWHGPPGIRH